MIETKPWPGHPELEAMGELPAGAQTLELSTDEVRQALIEYICRSKESNFRGRCFVQVQFERGDLVDVVARVTYWPHEEESDK